MSKKAIIICGFPGVGKSCVANNRTNILDAESSAFSWKVDPEHPEKDMVRNPDFPDNYIRYVEKNMAIYACDVVLASSHGEVRNELKMRGIPYIIVAPRRELKNEYLIRYLQRGNNIEFIELLNDKWDAFLDEIERDGAPVIWLGSGEYMSDVLGEIAR